MLRERLADRNVESFVWRSWFLCWQSIIPILVLHSPTNGRVIKLARAIADLAGEERIGAHHVAEALQYRPREHSV